MSKNDTKIKEVLAQIEKKKSEIGTRPKAAWKSNGILKTIEGHINVNTILTLQACINAASLIMRDQYAISEAAKFLNVKLEEDNLSDYLADIKLRSEMIKFDIENKKLVAMEAGLKALRSEDAKTEDAISAILKEL